MSHIKKQEKKKKPKKNSNETEISKLPDKKFRDMVKKLESTKEKLKENFNKEL